MGSAEEFGPYVVYEQIGLGGMATVHRAETQGIAGFSKQVALKRMLPNVAADAKAVQAFIHEARLASNLHHANVAQTYDLGKVGETYFIAMELVPGRNLRELVKLCTAKQQAMPIPITLNIITQICDALDYAHNLCDESGKPLGIIHRDVSPSNVIIGEGGIAKLIDFGIAKAAASMHTLAGTIKGKFSYMAPEYLEGFLDARVDLFAAGVIAYELLSNRPLFQGRDDMDTLERIRAMPILPPSTVNPAVPPEIDALVMTALERDPGKRWQTAAAFRIAITGEAQRLGLVAHNRDVEQWMQGAFTRAETESPEISVSGGTYELSRGSNPAWHRLPTNTIVEDEQPSVTVATKQLKAPRATPRNDFSDMAPTRADAAAIDSLAASPLARRPDIFDTPTVAGVSIADIEKAKQRDDDDDDDLPTLSASRAKPDDEPATFADEPSAVDVAPRPVKLPDAPASALSYWLLTVIVLIAAGGAAGVVYFAQP